MLGQHLYGPNLGGIGSQPMPTFSSGIPMPNAINTQGPSLPGKYMSDLIYTIVMKMISEDPKVKGMLDNRIKVAIDASRNHYNGSLPSYEALTSGSVNLQARMSASGYSTYGRSIIRGNETIGKNNAYRKMKNRVHLNNSNDQTNRGNINYI